MRAVMRDSYEADVVEASKQRPVLVDFWGPRCGPCLKMLPWVEQLAERNAGRLTVVQVNAAENRRLCVDLRVLGLPTFILYRDGAEVRRLTGDGCTPATIAAVVQDLVPDVEVAGAGAGVDGA